MGLSPADGLRPPSLCPLPKRLTILNLTTCSYVSARNAIETAD